ncbi:MAG: hypothetical protein WC713_04300 [Candidatus Methylomirabilota bacterium]
MKATAEERCHRCDRELAKTTDRSEIGNGKCQMIGASVDERRGSHWTLADHRRAAEDCLSHSVDWRVLAKTSLVRIAEIEVRLTQANACIRAMVNHMCSVDDAWLEEIAEDLYGDSIAYAEYDALRATTAELEALRIEHARFAAVLAVENWKRGSAEPFGAVPVLERARNQAHAIDTVTYPEACREAREALRAKEGTR